MPGVKTQMRRLNLAAFLVSIALAAAACGSSASPSPAGAASQGGAASQAPSVGPGASSAAVCEEVAEADISSPVAATIKDFTFAPEPVKAKVDQVVAWTNNDSTAHTASVSDGSCGTQNIAAGATGALVFHKAGTYPYQCNIHSSMKGTIEVQ